MFAEVPSSPTIKAVGQTSDSFKLLADDCIVALECELFALRSNKPVFDGVHIPRPAYLTKPKSGPIASKRDEDVTPSKNPSASIVEIEEEPS